MPLANFQDFEPSSGRRKKWPFFEMGNRRNRIRVCGSVKRESVYTHPRFPVITIPLTAFPLEAVPISPPPLGNNNHNSELERECIFTSLIFFPHAFFFFSRSSETLLGKDSRKLASLAAKTALVKPSYWSKVHSLSSFRCCNNGYFGPFFVACPLFRCWTQRIKISPRFIILILRRHRLFSPCASLTPVGDLAIE